MAALHISGSGILEETPHIWWQRTRDESIPEEQTMSKAKNRKTKEMSEEIEDREEQNTTSEESEASSHTIPELLEPIFYTTWCDPVSISNQ